MESNVRALQDRNDRAATRELAELRADTIEGLKYAFQHQGAGGVIDLLQEAAVLSPIFDWFADAKRAEIHYTATGYPPEGV